MKRGVVGHNDAFRLPDEQIELSHSFYFTWGYPDYVRHAFRVLQEARSPAVPADTRRELTWSQLRQALDEADSARVRYLVAGNPNTPANVLHFLAQKGNSKVARRVAENPNVHAATLELLAEHEDAEVRLSVCDSPRAPEGVLLKLTADGDADVRYYMAENSNLPLTVLEVLCGDENPYVAARARSTVAALTNKAEVLVPDFSRVARRRIGRNVISQGTSQGPERRHR